MVYGSAGFQDDGVVYDVDIIVGAELHPDMLDRKTKYKWEITPIDNNENTLICNNIRILSERNA